jgi:cysteinyl-tRNA synthetase
LNTPKALAELFVLAKDVSTPAKKAALLNAGKVLGLLQQDPADWFATDDSSVDHTEVERLIAERQSARAAKDYAAADAARDALTALGVVIEDTPDGTIWRLAR